MSAIIEKLLGENGSGANGYCVAYFYFKHEQPNKESHNSLLRAILWQLIGKDPAICDHLYGSILSTEEVNLRSTKKLEELVMTALESYRISYIVLDGLDECAPNEAPKSVKWFLSLVNGKLQATSAVLRVLFCGQRDGVLDKLLATQPSISLETPCHIEDVRRYCRDFCGKIREKFDIPPKMEEDIITRVANEAEGI